MKRIRQKHKILREVYRNYLMFKDYVTYTGHDTIEYDGLVISFHDLSQGLDHLSPRKKEAFYYNVIRDMRQRDVAEIMGITTVSVGQYVEHAVLQLSQDYFGKDEELISEK